MGTTYVLGLMETDARLISDYGMRTRMEASSAGAQKHAWHLSRCGKGVLSGEQIAYGILLFLFMAVCVSEASFLSGIVAHANITRTAIVLCMLVIDFARNGRRSFTVRLSNASYVFAGATVLLLAISMLSVQYLIAWVFAIAFCSRSFNSRFLISVWLASCTTCVLAVVGLSAVGVLPDFVIEGRGFFGRHSFGFHYATFLSHYYLGIVAAIIFIRRGRITYPELFALGVVDVFIYIMTDARNSFLLVMLLLVGCFWVKTRRRAHFHCPSLIRAFSKYCFLICAAASFAVLFGIDPDGQIGAWLDKVLSGRIGLTQAASIEYPLNPMGNDVQWSTYQLLRDGSVGTGYYDDSGRFVETAYLYVDCSYVQIAMSAGLIVFAIVIALLTRFTVQVARMQDWTVGVLASVFAIHSIIDPQLLGLTVCPLLLLVFNSSYKLERPVFSRLRLC